MKKNRTYQNEIPSYARVKKYPEYWRLVHWSATPSPLRKPATLADLAKELSLHATTLVRWERIPEFYGDVRSRIKETLRNDMPDIMYTLRNKIFKEGNSKEIKLFLQWADDFVEKTEIEHKGLPEATPEVQQLAKQFEDKLKEALSKKPDG